jgi:uncharacterized protein YndB with AHSA1/START domain
MADAAASDIVITRVFDAPRRLVWTVWTDPEHVAQWWGPAQFTAPRCEVDLRVGGRYLLCMRSPQGRESYTGGEFREIVAPERLVYTQCIADADGNLLPGSSSGMPGFPDETLVTVTFVERGGQTEVTLRHAGLPAPVATMAGGGWAQSLDKIAAILAGLSPRA